MGNHSSVFPGTIADNLTPEKLPEPSFQAFVIRGGRTKHGSRRWRKLEFVQAVIALHFPQALSERVDHSRLTRKVNKQLKRDRNYTLGEVTRPTVIRALRKVRAANS
jgi:hypothetical protein